MEVQVEVLEMMWVLVLSYEDYVAVTEINGDQLMGLLLVNHPQRCQSRLLAAVSLLASISRC